MSDLISCTIVKARKDHTCDFCLGTIKKSERYESSKVSGEGRIWSWKSCLDCQKIILEYGIESYDDGLTQEEFDEKVRQICREQNLFLDDEGNLDCNIELHQMVQKLVEAL